MNLQTFLGKTIQQWRDWALYESGPITRGKKAAEIRALAARSEVARTAHLARLLVRVLAILERREDDRQPVLTAVQVGPPDLPREGDGWPVTTWSLYALPSAGGDLLGVLIEAPDGWTVWRERRVCEPPVSTRDYALRSVGWVETGPAELH